MDPISPPPLTGPTSEQKNWAMIAHLCGLLLTIPLINIVGPLLIWRIKRQELGEFVGASAREALNFQFTFVVLLLFCFSLWFLPVVGVLGLMLIPIFSVANIAYCIAAAIHTSEGDVYRYPWALRVF